MLLLLNFIIFSFITMALQPISREEVQSNFFLYGLIAAFFVIVLILIGRECFNWYVKHNAMLS